MTEAGSAVEGGFALRTVLFGLAATAALAGPWLLGLDVGPWRGIDGALLVLLVSGVVCFGWPSVDRRGGPRALLDLSVGAGSMIPFGLLGASVAGEAIGSAQAILVAGGLALALIWTGRLGGWPGAAAAVALVALLGWGSGGEGRGPAPGPVVEMLPVDLALRGPLGAARVRVGDAPPLEIISNLDVGASRRLRAWIPVPTERPPGPVVPRVEALSPGPLAADDRVAVVMAPGWSPDPALAARPRPPAPPVVRRAPAPAGLLGAWTAMLLLLAVRRSFQPRRPWTGAALGAAVGLGATVALTQLPQLASPEGLGPGVRSLEGVAGASPWLQVDRRRVALRLDGLGPGPAAIELHGRPPRRCTLDLTGPAGRLEVVLADGAVADLLRPLDPGLRPLQPAINGWGDLDPGWVREGARGWRATGPWRLGEGRSGPEAGRPDDAAAFASPPAWGLGGLEGAGWVVLGRLSGEGFKGLGGPEGALGADDAGAGENGDTWIRVTGAPAPEER